MRRSGILHKAPRGIFFFWRIRFFLLIFFLIGSNVLGALVVVIVSWGTVLVASAAVGRLILTIALPRGTATFGVPSSWLIGAPGVSPVTSLLTFAELGDLIAHHLVEAITIDLHKLFFDNLQASTFPSEMGPCGALGFLKAASCFHVLQNGKLQYGS